MELKSLVKLNIFRIRNITKNKYKCPICTYWGAFLDMTPETGLRKHAKCPSCSSLERHRLQKLVIDNLSKKYDFSKMRILHFAPESFFINPFKSAFKDYISADICMEGVDFVVDIQNLPFADAEFDFVFASHVLEHVKNDIDAVLEVRRVLRPGGIAILPVPIIGSVTIEYPEPNPFESLHVRAPGVDYYDRYVHYFSRVDRLSSSDFPETYQTFIYEDRSKFPSPKSPLRSPGIGDKHVDIVPVCIA